MTATRLTYRRDGDRYQVFVGDARTGVLVGFVEQTDTIMASNAGTAREWVAIEPNGSWVSTDRTRAAAAQALVR